MAVYFARAETTNLVKIGFAVSVERRMLHLQAGCPYRLTVARVVEGDRLTEAAFHTLFAEHRLEREWFNWAPEMLTAAALAKTPVVADGVTHEVQAIKREMREDGVTVTDLAVNSGFGRRTLYEWFSAGDVPGTGMAREYRIRAIREALEKARAEQAQPKRRAKAAA